MKKVILLFVAVLGMAATINAQSTQYKTWNHLTDNTSYSTSFVLDGYQVGVQDLMQQLVLVSGNDTGVSYSINSSSGVITFTDTSYPPFSNYTRVLVYKLQYRTAQCIIKPSNPCWQDAGEELQLTINTTYSGGGPK